MEYLDSSAKSLAFLRQQRGVALLFYADWCPFSITMRTAFEAVEHHHKDLLFGKVRLDVIPRGELIFPIDAMPTLLLLYRDKVYDKFIGVMNPDELSLRLAKFQDLIRPGQPIVGSPLLVRSEKYIVILQLPHDITRYRTRSRLIALDNESGDKVGECVLDRTLTHVLLFLEYAKRTELKTGILRDGQLTERGRRLIRSLKQEMDIPRTAVLRVEQADSSQDPAGYLVKQIWRLNNLVHKKSKLIPEPLIMNHEGEYQLNENVLLHVERP